MSIGDTARKSYEAARSELVARLKLRDQVLLIYLAVVGTIFGIALANMERVEILLIIPFISLGCTILVSQHNLVIGTLIEFIGNQIKPELLGLSPPEYATFFVCSKVYEHHCTRSNRFRLWGHGIIIIIPNLAGLGYNINHAIKSPFPMGTLWWFGLVLMIISLWIILYTHQLRSEVTKKTK